MRHSLNIPNILQPYSMALGTLVLVNPPKGKSKGGSSKSRRKTKMAEQPVPAQRKRLPDQPASLLPAVVLAARSAAARGMAHSSPQRKAWRKEATSSSRRRPTKSRSTAASVLLQRKATKTRKANAAKRSRAAKKAAATRKRNSGKRKSSAKRKSTKRKAKGHCRLAALLPARLLQLASATLQSAAVLQRSCCNSQAQLSWRKAPLLEAPHFQAQVLQAPFYQEGKLSKMFTKKKFTASIMMGVGIVVTGALGLGLMGAVNNYGTQILSSTGILGYYSSALSAAGQYAGTVDFLVKMGVAGSVLAFGMSKLFGTKGLLSGAGKSAFGCQRLCCCLRFHCCCSGSLRNVRGCKEPTNRCRSDPEPCFWRCLRCCRSLQTDGWPQQEHGGGYRRMYGHGNNHNLGMSRPSVNR